MVFNRLTDPSRLPLWNRAITEAVEAPENLVVGSVWKVRLHVLGQSWISRSQVTILDPAGGIFGYRSQTDDGNPRTPIGSGTLPLSRMFQQSLFPSSSVRPPSGESTYWSEFGALPSVGRCTIR
jgi:hypothetical protein